MADRLRHKVALVTGAGSGIGAATATLFAAEGASVALADLRSGSVEERAAALAGRGEAAVALAGDVTRSADAERMVQSVVERFGRIDILVNCAGVTPRYAPPEWDYERTWDWVIGVNLKGTYLMSRFATARMQQQGGGAVVNLSSIYGLVGRPTFFGTGHDPYPPAKGGIITLTKDMANALGKHGIRINALCPGFIYTHMTRTLTDDSDWLSQMEAMEPLGRLGQPDEVARAALFLASDDASFITGVALPVDGGYTAQ
ncbi:MAG: SDR family oxidoreductase [Spirochaetaceae bacterium]|nr:SDR family oxidoreductase [Spirochaetaceae bacterium]